MTGARLIGLTIAVAGAAAIVVWFRQGDPTPPAQPATFPPSQPASAPATPDQADEPVAGSDGTANGNERVASPAGTAPARSTVAITEPNSGFETRMFVPANPLAAAGIQLVTFETNQLTDAARDVLQLDDQEAASLQAFFEIVRREVRERRRTNGTVHRQSNGMVTIDYEESEWRDYVADKEAEIERLLDARSRSILTAVRTQQLLVSPFMLGLAGAEPIPEQPGMVMTSVRYLGYTFHIPLSQAALDTIL